MQGHKQCSLYGLLAWANFTNLYSSHDGLEPNPQVFGLEMAEWTRKAPFCHHNLQNPFEPICKHTEPKSRHRGLEGALVTNMPKKAKYISLTTLFQPLLSRVSNSQHRWMKSIPNLPQDLYITLYSTSQLPNLKKAPSKDVKQSFSLHHGETVQRVKWIWT